ncbi:group II truncated hemoglobin [Roseateles oligotrophus]|uniref:Group II truncated hemoglobin n=1 Tax=Roseateles oligotrophus TaxID=1769250 RepID=A0ABT2YA79_9BURK|nr:group II truncated hemoglobin [Roseateles oligotrophus]MCV2367209.1 group II truncated hemoglobin [Roseateles oligotrophus]
MQDNTNTPTTLFDLLGGETGIRSLVDHFYDHMDLDGEFALIRQLHPASLGGSRDKLHWFLCGWSGGPDLYIERFGHPRLRARHLPYPIGIAERDQWMACMRLAMQDSQLDPDLQQRLGESFHATADWMRNRGA